MDKSFQLTLSVLLLLLCYYYFARGKELKPSQLLCRIKCNLFKQITILTLFLSEYHQTKIGLCLVKNSNADAKIQNSPFTIAPARKKGTNYANLLTCGAIY